MAALRAWLTVDKRVDDSVDMMAASMDFLKVAKLAVQWAAVKVDSMVEKWVADLAALWD